MQKEGDRQAVSELRTLGANSEINDGEMKAFDVDDLTIAVAKVGGKVYAFGDTCTHQQCPLSDGDLEETTVTCPCHGSQFDVTSGAVLEGPAEDPVASYPVTVSDDSIQVEI